VHGVAGAVGHDVAEDLLSYQSQVPDEIENFVADEFVWIAQRRVHEPVGSQNDGVFDGSAPNQPLLAHGVGFVQEAECAAEAISRR